MDEGGELEVEAEEEEEDDDLGWARVGPWEARMYRYMLEKFQGEGHR